MRIATRGLTAAFLLMPLAAGPAHAAGSKAIEVTARLLYNTPDGATEVAESASAMIAEGEMGALALSAAAVSDAERGCDLGEADGYRWRVNVALGKASQSGFGMRVMWSRAGGSGAELQEELDLRLEPGERRVLDFARLAPAAPDSACRVDALLVELQPRPLSDPRYAGRELRFGFWFSRLSETDPEYSSFELVVPQGEPVAFAIPPVTSQVDLAAGTRGSLRSQGRGTLTYWLTGPDTMTIRLEAVVRHLLRPGEVTVAAGEGAKLFDARVGETVEIELPPLEAVIMAPTESLNLSGTPARGVTVLGADTALDLSQLAAGWDYSLFVRAGE